MWLEDVFGNDYFSRSGAVIALLALGLLWLWLHYGEELEFTRSAVSAMQQCAGENHGNDFQNILAFTLRSYPNVPAELQINLARTTHQFVIDGPQLTGELADVTKSLGFSQIEVAAMGTFVWAFGDLMF